MDDKIYSKKTKSSTKHDNDDGGDKYLIRIRI